MALNEGLSNPIDECGTGGEGKCQGSPCNGNTKVNVGNGEEECKSPANAIENYCCKDAVQ